MTVRQLAASLTARLTHRGLNGSAGARKATAFLLSAIDDRLAVPTPHGELKFGVSNPLERWRAETLLDKEPDTIAWLESTIRPDSLLYDVGANIGVYSLYAANVHRGATRAIAFEPEALNFSRLYRNIFHNGLSDRIGALPLAIGAKSGIGRLALSGITAGAARHVASDTGATPLGGFTEWTVASSLDGFRAGVDPAWATPTHLKIDVDGPEIEVLEGARGLLSDPRLRHVLVELASDSANRGIEILCEAGLRLVSRGEKHDGWANHIFERPPQL